MPRIILTPEERLERKRASNRAYRLANIDRLNIKQALYRANNKEAMSEGQQRYRLNNVEKLRARKHADYMKRRETILAQQLAHRQQDLAKARAGYRAFSHKHHERVTAKARAYRMTHREELRLKSSAYAKTHPDIVATNRTKRRAWKNGAPLNDLTHAQWLEIQAVQDYRCWYCGKHCQNRLTQDHIQPLSKGGSHTLHNVIGACRSCNTKKYDGPPLKPVQPLLLTIAPSKKKQGS